jgi:hypothetical protein
VELDRQAIAAVTAAHGLTEADEREALQHLVEPRGRLARAPEAAIHGLRDLAAAVRAVGRAQPPLGPLARRLARWRVRERVEFALCLIRPGVSAAEIEEAAGALIAGQGPGPAPAALETAGAAGELGSRLAAAARAAAEAPGETEGGADADDPAILLGLADGPTPALRALAIAALAGLRPGAGPIDARIRGAQQDDADPMVQEAARLALAERESSGRRPAWADAAAPFAAGASLTILERLFLLDAIPLLRDVDPDGLRALAEVTTTACFAAGEALAREGEPGPSAILILTGRVRVSQRGRQLRECGPNTCIGEMAVLDPAPRSATAVAIDPVRAVVISAPEFRSLLRHRPGIASDLLTELVRRLREAEGRTG